MIAQHLHVSWFEAPTEMNFVSNLDDLVHDINSDLDGLYDDHNKALDLFLKVPALVQLTLDHKIELETKPFPRSRTKQHELRQAVQVYLSSVSLARDLYDLGKDARPWLLGWYSALPGEVKRRVFESRADKYTWLSSEPYKISRLAQKIKHNYDPQVIIGCAHGAVSSGLLLANELNLPLYFIRNSRFKRRDTEPVLSASDKRFVGRYLQTNALLLDEDVASGDTIERLEKSLNKYFKGVKTASVMCHYLSPKRPDFVSETWFD